MLWVLIRIALTNRLDKAILMSTNNMGFYEDLTKITFQLSSNTVQTLSLPLRLVNLFLTNRIWFAHKKNSMKEMLG